MTEVWFYHLQRAPLERALPELLERTLERGWRAVVMAGSTERVSALDAMLWSYRDDSFLPHGSDEDGHTEQQPVYLTVDEKNPNQANVIFLVDGAIAQDVAAYDRCIHLFDGNDPEAVENARAQWRAAQEASFEVTYWQQNTAGRWEKAG